MEYVAMDTMERKVIGLCEDMCPEQERIQRYNERLVNKLELPLSYLKNSVHVALKDTMVKRFQRSSADHNLQIAELLRTPETLQRTISYIETRIMPQMPLYSSDIDKNSVDEKHVLSSYLFIWDRYRMIAKDFTLQQPVIPVTEVWIICYERMVRWFVLLDYRMKIYSEFVQGHAQQHSEQLHNLLGTLLSYYYTDNVDKSNRGEFVAYFILLYASNNAGEIAKYLRTLPPLLLLNADVLFAIKVYLSIIQKNYIRFFRSMRQASLLQACLMDRYANDMRLTAMLCICRACFVNTNNTQKSAQSKVNVLSLSYLQETLLFETIQEGIDFVHHHCGLEVFSDDSDDNHIPSTNAHEFIPMSYFVRLKKPPFRINQHAVAGDDSNANSSTMTLYIEHSIRKKLNLEGNRERSDYYWTEICNGSSY